VGVGVGTSDGTADGAGVGAGVGAALVAVMSKVTEPVDVAAVDSVKVFAVTDTAVTVADVLTTKGSLTTDDVAGVLIVMVAPLTAVATVKPVTVVPVVTLTPVRVDPTATPTVLETSVRMGEPDVVVAVSPVATVEPMVTATKAAVSGTLTVLRPVVSVQAVRVTTLPTCTNVGEGVGFDDGEGVGLPTTQVGVVVLGTGVGALITYVGDRVGVIVGKEIGEGVGCGVGLPTT